MADPDEAAAVDTRTCTCHPNDNPPVPCPRKYALTHCRAAYLGRPKEPVKRPPMCEGCGKHRSDPPSKLCVGCQAYRDHQS